jgi:hypothetical protein
MPRVRVRAALPMEATPELLEKLEKDRARRELAGRASGQPVASADVATVRFPATWRTVKFRDTATSNVDNGDCEMLEQLVEHVLLKMGVREAADSSLNCGAPQQVPLNAVRLNLEVLAPPPVEQAGTPPGAKP